LRIADLTMEYSTGIVSAIVESEPIKVLHVDDDPSILKVAKACLEIDDNFQVESVTSAEEAWMKLKMEEFNAVVSDYQMPEKDGLEFLKELRESNNNIPFIVFTGKGREAVAIQALNLGADRYIDKTGNPKTVYGELAHAIKKSVTSRFAEQRLKASEERFRSIVENAGDAIYVLDKQGNFLDLNHKAEELTGFNRADFIGHPFRMILPDGGSPKAVERSNQVISGKLARVELEIKTASDYNVPVELTSTPLVIGGKTVGTLGIVRDITQRREIEEGLKESERRFRLLFNRVFDALVVINAEGEVVDVNEAACKLLNYTKSELLKLRIENLHPKEEMEKIQAAVERVMEKGVDYMGPTAFVDKSGKVVSVEGGGVTLKIGSDVYIMGSFRDITERKKTEQMRRSMIERSPDGIVTVDTKGVITSCNTASTKMLGFSKSELIDKHFVKTGVLKMRQLPKFLSLFRRVLKGNLVKPLELTFYRKDGTSLLCEVRLGLLKEGGKITGIQAISRDITERKKAEKALRESQEKFKRFFMSNPEAADYLDPNFQVLDVNSRFEELFGYSREEVLSKGINDLLVPEDKWEEAEMLDKNAEKGYVYYESVRRRKDGTLIPVSISAAPIVVNGKLIGTVGLYKDISQLKKTERALKNTLEKLEIMNEKLRVVGGFTRHDVLNKFSGILGNVYLAKKRLAEGHESLIFLKEIESSCQEAKALFDFAETYEKLGLEELVYINVDTAIKRALSLFPDLHKYRILVECQGLEVLADSLLQQLFYNLIHNTVEHGEKVRQIRIWYEEDKHELKLVYQDDGIGIPSSDKLQIFEADPRRSTGYGLHLIKKICEVYGWSIRETGKQGKGAQFTITIPRSHKSGIEGYQLNCTKKPNKRFNRSRPACAKLASE